MEEKKTLKEWFEEKSELAKWKAQLLVDWCNRNKQAIIIFGPVIAGGIIEIIKISTRYYTVNKEKALKERYVYDRSEGHYWEMKRKPKPSEYLQISQRKDNGEKLGSILNDMGLLKK